MNDWYARDISRKIKSAIKSRLKVIEQLIIKVYENLLEDKLTNDNYNLLLSKYQEKQQNLKNKLSLIEQQESIESDTLERFINFTKALYDVHDLNNLTRQDICRLINKIVVHPKIKKE